MICIKLSTVLPFLVICCSLPLLISCQFFGGFSGFHPMVSGHQCAGAFPGTPQWVACLGNQNMNYFHAPVNSFIPSVPQYFPQMQAGAGSIKSAIRQFGSSHVSSNGYNIQSSGLSVNTRSLNKVFTVESYVGTPDDVKVTTEGKTITWKIISKGRSEKLISMTVPDSVDVNKIKHEVKNKRLIITGPTSPGTGFGYGGSFSSGFSVK